MLGKLIKYDFKSMLRRFVPLWIAFLAVSVINRFTVRMPDFGNAAFASILTGVLMFLYVILMIAINVIGIILVVQRFYSGLLGDEGYLMFTLPVKPWQHVCSKGITATVLILVNGLISVASLLIMAANEEIFKFMRDVIDAVTRSGVSAGLAGFLLAVLMLTAILVSIYHVYAAMALGHLASKHRVAVSVCAYIAISIAVSIIAGIMAAIFATIGEGSWLYKTVASFVETSSVNGITVGAFVVLIVIELVQLIPFYIITERILTKKLNLE